MGSVHNYLDPKNVATPVLNHNMFHPQLRPSLYAGMCQNLGHSISQSVLANHKIF